MEPCGTIDPVREVEDLCREGGAGSLGLKNRMNMKTRIGLLILLALALARPVATLMTAAQAGRGAVAAPTRPQGPCDIYAAAGAPCVAAHSSTRALSAS